MGRIRGMKRTTVIMALAISILWVAAAVADNVSPPLLPAAYYGSITSSDGSHVEEGIVEAAINGVIRGEIEVEDDKFGGPGLADKLSIEGTVEDKGIEINFKVDGIPATSSRVLWTSGEVKNLDLTVPYTFSGISAGSDLSLVIGENAQLTVTAQYSNDQQQTLTSNVEYNSSNDDIAQVSGSGKITAVAVGTAKITVSYLYNKETSVTVTVAAAGGGGGGGGGGGDTSTGIQEDVDTIIDDLISGTIDPVQAVGQIIGMIDDLVGDQVSTGDIEALREGIQNVLARAGQLPASSVSVTTASDGQHVSVNETTLVDQIEQLGDLRQSLLDSINRANLGDLASGVNPSVVITAPSGTTIEQGLKLDIPENAANAAVENNVGIIFKTDTITFDLPPEVIKSLTNLTGDLAGLEISVHQVTEQLEAAEGNELLGTPLDLNIAANDEEGLEFKPASYDTKVTITVSLDGVDLSQIDTRKLGVYRQVDRYNEATGQTEKVWEYMGGRISEDGKSIIFETDHTSIYAVMMSNVTFGDIQKHWAKDTIEVLTAHQIIKGLTKDQFGPDAPVTRAQFTAIVLRALQIPEKTSTTQTFADVKTGAWYHSAIETAYAEGLADGVGNGRFAPDQKITRQEMAVFISRALKKAGNQEIVNADQAGELLAVFKDQASIASWSKISIAKAVKLEIITGRTKDTFVPKANATRAESAVMVYRMLKALGQIN